MPELTLPHLSKALPKATLAERNAIRAGIEALEKLLQSPGRETYPASSSLITVTLL